MTTPYSDACGNLLVSQLANDPEMRELIHAFVQGLPRRVSELQSALRENDLQGLICIAHQMKGAAGGYGFPAITDAARALETAARSAADVQTLTEGVNVVARLCACARARPVGT